MESRITRLEDNHDAQAREIADIRERLAKIETSLLSVQSQQKTNGDTLASIDKRLANWRGGVGVVLALGAFVGSLVTAIAAVLVKHHLEK